MHDFDSPERFLHVLPWFLVMSCSLLHECLEMITVMEDAPSHIFGWDLGGRGQQSEVELKNKCFLGMPFTELLNTTSQSRLWSLNKGDTLKDISNKVCLGGMLWKHMGQIEYFAAWVTSCKGKGRFSWTDWWLASYWVKKWLFFPLFWIYNNMK